MEAVNLDALASAFDAVVSLQTVLFIILGIVLGLAVGVIPGLSAPTAIALSLPLVLVLPSAQALGFLIGCYKASTFGGSITAICIGTPGDPCSAATVADGYVLAKKGHAGKAMNAALYSSVTGDLVGSLVCIFAAVPLALLAPMFGPAEMAMLLILAMTLIVAFSGNDPGRALISAGIGFLLVTVGRDAMTGELRMTMGVNSLSGGVPLVSLLMGLFAVPAIIEAYHAIRAGGPGAPGGADAFSGKSLGSRLSLREYMGLWRGFGIGTTVGVLIGGLPGAGSTLAAYSAYGTAFRFAKRPEDFGKGSLEGIAAAEAGNNASVSPGFVPLLAFGIPGSITVALFGAALMMKGVMAGPRVVIDHPEIVYSLFLLLLLTNPILLVVAKILIPIFVAITRLPSILIWPIVAVLVLIGAYAYEMRAFDITTVVFAGGLGFLLFWFAIPVGPLILAFLIGGAFEVAIRQGLLIGHGDLTFFFRSPLSLTLACLIVASVIFFARGKRKIEILGDG